MRLRRRQRKIERRSERLVLRPLVASDLDVFVASIDEAVMRWQGFTPETVEAFRVRFAQVVNETYYDWPCNLAVCDGSTGEFLGHYGLENVGPGGTSARLGWWLCAHARGRGLGTESLRLALRYAHVDVHIRRVVMGTTPENERAIAQIKAVGGVLTETTAYTPPNGETTEAVWFQHLAPKAS